jgi:hypothetical protein
MFPFVTHPVKEYLHRGRIAESGSDLIEDDTHAVFVTNVPPLQKIPHHIFMKWFSRCGEVTHYNINHNKRTAKIVYNDKECVEKALRLDRSFTEECGKTMFVTRAVPHTCFAIFRLFRKQEWQQAYDRVTGGVLIQADDEETIPFNTFLLTQNQSFLSVLAHYYELIACEHLQLFMWINQFIDQVLDQGRLERQVYVHNKENHMLLLLLARREGWFARKEKLQQYLQQSSTLPFPDDVVKHILIDYLF